MRLMRPTLSAGFALLFFCFGSTGNAAPIEPGQFRVYVDAIQDILIPAASPLNDTGADIQLVEVSAKGFFTFDHGQEDEINGTMSMTGGNFFGLGSAPGLGDFELFAGAANGLTPMTGTLSDIIKDPLGSSDPASMLVAFGVFDVPDFGIRLLDLPGGPVGATVVDPFQFEVFLDGGLNPSLGVQFVDFANPDLDALVGATAVATSNNRRLQVTAVPEPTSLAAVSVLAGGWCLRRKKRRV